MGLRNERVRIRIRIRVTVRVGVRVRVGERVRVRALTAAKNVGMSEINHGSDGGECATGGPDS